MAHLLPREREFAVDLESGIITSHKVGIPEIGPGDKLPKTFFNKFFGGFMSVDVSLKGDNVVKLNVNSSNSHEGSPEKLKLLIDTKVEGEKSGDITGKKMGKEKRKKTSAKKPPKPPRPPRGLSLDAADQKLIKEIAELAMIRRARIERMKALKKMKGSKASSPNGSMFAMLFTVLFFLVILFQGMSGGSSSGSFHGSPETAHAKENGLIMVQDHLNPSASFTVVPSSISLNVVEQVSCSESKTTG